MKTETVTVERGATDAMSNRTNTNHTIGVIFEWGTGTRSTGRFALDRDHRESATVTARIFVKRGTDVQARDRILRSNGQEYIVVGHSMWDQANPITGHDFGYMTFQVTSASG